MKLLIVLCLVAAVTADFSEFMKKRGRKYKSAEEASRAEGHYNRHKKFFDEHNAKFAAGKVHFKVGENEFTDQNNTELVAQMCRTIQPKQMRAAQGEQDPDTFPPGAPSANWTYTMQPIAYQGNCGSCWAFATVAQLESLYKRNSYNYVMSPQYIVDCSHTSPNSGCDGGWPGKAMRDILATGMPLNASYPYIRPFVTGTCKSPLPAFVSPKLETQVVSYPLHGNETLLKNIVSQDGPVVVVIAATSLFFQYDSGIFSDDACPTTCDTNHAVVVVGYGTDQESGLDYWIVRNSWGLHWGERGYARMARNKNNSCAIACNAMYMK